MQRNHRSRNILGVASAVAILAIAGVALAASVHLKGGKNAEPAFRDEGLSLTAAAELAGLGNGDVLVSLEAQADVTATCSNRGGNQPPGQNPAPVSVAGAVAIPEEEIKNGNTPFNVETQEPETPIPGAPDCPNRNFTEDIVDLAFTEATITVEQPRGTVVLIIDCTFSEPTSDGSVRANEVDCTQTSF
jgi:hypothetical protein